MKNKMLLICGHTPLEYNHMKMFTDLGLEVLSTGNYLFPDRLPNGNEHFPLLNIEYDKELRKEFLQLNPNGYIYGKNILNLNKSFVNKFDIILNCYILEPVVNDWELIKNKLIIYESLGQSDPGRELLLNKLKNLGLKVVRTSTGEAYFKNYCGEDAVIDLAVDTEYFKDWKGEDEHILTINAAFKKRAQACAYNEYLQIAKDLPCKLAGALNEDINLPFNIGTLTREAILKEYQKNRVGFASLSRPCPFTLIPKEMLSTGMPIVTYGPKIGGPTFKVHEYLDKYHAGFWSDNLQEIKDYLKLLLKDFALAKTFSKNARKLAESEFSEKIIKEKWKTFLMESL